jgi:predicted ATPase/DNA-binding winged helix-turn-helix (wHTH) protein
MSEIAVNSLSPRGFRDRQQALLECLRRQHVAASREVAVQEVLGSYRFGAIEVNVAQRQLMIEGRSRPVGARAFDLLVALIERRERLATKNELLDAVWPEEAVEENNLVVQVGNLRKLLGGQAIATIPGRGYRFTLPAGEDTGRLAGVAPTATETSAPPPIDELRSNLPATLPALLGRDHELTAIGALLDEHRLTTLTGTGGIGKTRLAQQLLSERRAGYAQGVCWVELAALSDATQVVGTIASRLGVAAPVGNAEALERLAGTLAPMQLLLGLDNAEHLIDEVARVVIGLLAAAPRIRFIVTSQVPLGIDAEQNFQVKPLALPGAGRIAPAEAMRFGAVALFAARAAAADHRFALSEQNVAAVVGICRRLDGIALAIEMAAARTRTLGVSALAALMDHQLDVLGAERRDLPQRQRTLRATLEWSHRLLRPIEQTVLRRLGVFAGGFSLELALEVVPGTASEADRWEALDALGVLVDRSLVAVDGGEPPRYRLLESTSAFAAERLAEAGETGAWQARHAVAMRRLFVSVFNDRLRAFDLVLRRLELDVDNARAAMAWALEHDAETAVALAPSLARAMGEMPVGPLNIWAATEPLLSDAMPLAVRAAWAQGACHWNYVDQEYRVRWARVAVKLWREVGDSENLQLSLDRLINSRWSAYDEEQHAALAELQSMSSEGCPPKLLRLQLLAEARFLMNKNEAEKALAVLYRALPLAVAAGDRFDERFIIFAAADAALGAGRIDDAVRHGTELADRLRGTRDQRYLAFTLISLCGALLARSDVAEARRVLQEAWPLAAAYGLQLYCCECLALLAALEQRPEACARLLSHANARRLATPNVRDANERRIVDRAGKIGRSGMDALTFDEICARHTVLDDDAIAALGFAEHE